MNETIKMIDGVATATHASSPTASTSPAQLAAADAPIGRLYRDVLHHIFTFLDLSDFIDTCVVSTTWYASGRTMKPREEEFKFTRSIGLSLVRSPLRIHISRLDLFQEKTLTVNDLALLRDHMAHLELLRISIRLTPLSDETDETDSIVTFPLPQQLQFLDLEFSFAGFGYNSTEQAALVTQCLNSMTLQLKRLRTFELYLFNADESKWECPSALRNLTTLTALRLPYQYNQNQQIDLIKTLPSIIQWTPTHQLTPYHLQRLVDGSTTRPLVLQDIGHKLGEVNQNVANQLKRITTLTHLSCSMSLTDPTQLLPSFPHLFTLDLNCLDTVDVNLLSTALSACITLTECDLTYSSLENDHLARFLPHLTSLRSLTLIECDSLSSLQFLTVARSSLTNLLSFSLHFCRRIPVKEYHLNLPSISHSLHYLSVMYSSLERFDPITVEQWTPNSPAFRHDEWPQLKAFYLSQIDHESLEQVAEEEAVVPAGEEDDDEDEGGAASVEEAVVGSDSAGTVRPCHHTVNGHHNERGLARREDELALQVEKEVDSVQLKPRTDDPHEEDEQQMRMSSTTQVNHPPMTTPTTPTAT